MSRTIRNDCGNDHNGVAIFVRNGIYFQKLETFSDNSLQNVAIKIKYKQKDISIVSFYSPGNSVPNFDKSKFNRLLHSIPKPLIIAGDFNAHHTIWGCNRTNSRGRDIMDVMDDNDLMLLNNDQPTTVGTNSWRPNGLDLTIVSSSLFLCCEWQVHQDSLGSYHLPTITKFSMVVSETESSSIPSNIPPHSNLKIVNWDQYENLVNDLLKQFEINNCNLQKSYNNFCSIILRAVENSVPKTNYHCNNITHLPKRKRQLPWWNGQCTKVVEDCKQAYLLFKSNCNIQNYIHFKQAQAKKKRILRLERRKSWTDFCSTINRLTPMKQIWTKMRKFKNLYCNNNCFSSNNWISNFLHKYTPDTVPNLTNIHNNHPLNSTNSFMIAPFTIEELKAGLSSRKDSACGLDWLSYKMFKLLNSSNLNKFLKILNLLWNKSTIPEEWKTDCLIPILKHGKDSSSADSYRPITLSSCVGKIFEQLIKQRLIFYIESNNLLPNNQFGFRCGRSACESLRHLCLDIHSAQIDNKILAGVFWML